MAVAQKGRQMEIRRGMPVPRGVSFTKGGVNFAFAAPGKKECNLILYQSGGNVPLKKYPMKKETVSGDVYFLELAAEGMTAFEYNFEADGEICVDPYAQALAGREIWGRRADPKIHELRGRIVNQDFDWDGDQQPFLSYNEVIAYSLHVRGYTMHPAAKVKAKGTFSGLIEMIPYLQELGINQIQCMPIYEFDENQKSYRNYWGYGPAYYFAPKSSYCASGDGVSELKEMVKAYHQAGVEVVLDMPFVEGTSAALIVNCLFLYRYKYHIDGFILNPSVISLSMIREEPLLAGVKIMEKKDEFQNVMRAFLKGDEGMIRPVVSQLIHHSEKTGIFNYITNHTGFTLQDLVSYNEKHNEDNGEQNQDGPVHNYSWNCGVEGLSRKKSIMTLRSRQKQNAFFLLLSSQGTPCILAGDEFGNSQGGNNNVYCQDNEVGWVDWSRYKKECDLFLYVKELIRFRNSHLVFHPSEGLSGMNQTKYGVPDVSYHGESAWQIQDQLYSRQLGVYYSTEEDAGEDCFMAYNMHWKPQQFALPSLKNNKKWYRVMTTEDGKFQEYFLLKNQKEFSLKGRTAAIMIGRKIDVDESLDAF